VTSAAYDYAIVGAGMAGASLAAELTALTSGEPRIALLEAEDAPGYHATGRSAAFWEQCYGGPSVVPLTLASGTYLREHGFLRQRGALYIGRDQDADAITTFEHRFTGTGATFVRLNRRELAARIPNLRDTWQHAIWQPDCADIDVAGLHQHYLSRAARGGVHLFSRLHINQIERQHGGWHLTASDGCAVEAACMINAAGAWADQVAKLAGVSPKGIQPLRRTVAQLRVSPAAPADLPLVLDINGGFYFKPDAGRLWLSPHDETPSVPCDAAAEELDVAEAIDRLQSVVDWRVDRVERSWAGLRSFAPDRLPVYGPDTADNRFIWFAGQGGYGIQTAPAAARLLAEELTGAPRSLMTAEIDCAPYRANRFP
jgi:D-arginine dehydrogenase